MKVLVTGANGLIGRKVLAKLQSENISYLALSRNCVNKENFVQTDYSVENLIPLMNGFDAVIHLAASRGGANSSYEEYQPNEKLTENILKAMMQSDCHRIVYISSISVYSDLSKLPWKEDEMASPVNFYGLSKLTCEYLCKLYEKKGLSYTVLRCAHVLGIEDRGYMLSRFMKAAYEKKNLCVRGKSIAQREFVYVKDVANAIVWSLTCDQAKNQVINLGYGKGYTNLEIATLMNEAFDNVGHVDYQDDQSEGIVDSYMDVTRLYEYGFTPEYNIHTAMNDIYQEYCLIHRE